MVGAPMAMDWICPAVRVHAVLPSSFHFASSGCCLMRSGPLQMGVRCLQQSFWLHVAAFAGRVLVCSRATPTAVNACCR